ncbi:glycosyltransferase family 2 protein [Campylobacter molothri]|uniref:glycosyltransferase family 2 protein n=1 Tax=Campylobacter molothri TaxID=1032242 RepID=UPI0030995F2C|nr:glycosyltransferase family 2 protein [Campylobacter sp. RM3125]MBZ7970910.1 glycosyltransferase family 2 protein [Campylobacter sp. RM3124]
MDKVVGIVIPMYNIQDYLRECLDSVINQTYKNLQVVLVNDGSTDENSLNIAKEYTLKDERFILFDKKNGGINSARNLGIEYFNKEYKLKNITNDIKENSLIEFNIEGNNPYEIYKVYKSSKFFKNKDELLNFKTPDIDYIIFLDPDDYWELNCIEKCVFKMDGVEVVWFDFYDFYDGFDFELNNFKKSNIPIKPIASYINKRRYRKNMKKSNIPIKPIASLIEEYQYKENQKVSVEDFFKNILKIGFKGLWFGWQGMIDFSFLKSISLKYINQIMRHDDVTFGIMLFTQCNNIYVLTEKLYYYRIRKGSNMNHCNEKPHIPDCRLEDYTKAFNLFDQKYSVYNEYYSLSNFLLVAFVVFDFFMHSNLKNKDLLMQIFSNEMKVWRRGMLNFDNSYYEPGLYLSLKKIFQFSDNSDINLKFISGLIVDIVHFNDKYGTAKARIQNDIAYRLGQIMVINSKSFFGILFMPIFLLATVISYTQEKKAFKAKNKEDYLLPELVKYPDYKEGLKLRESYTYKLGEALVKGFEEWYKGRFLAFPFKALKLYKKFKYQE